MKMISSARCSSSFESTLKASSLLPSAVQTAATSLERNRDALVVCCRSLRIRSASSRLPIRAYTSAKRILFVVHAVVTLQRFGLLTGWPGRRHVCPSRYIPSTGERMHPGSADPVQLPASRAGLLDHTFAHGKEPSRNPKAQERKADRVVQRSESA